ncbi:hypothetical protein C357_23055 [Citreicella sp. 357]|nr:hypothetical protein C357_23055 [Citreicella sp. 357]
MYSGILVDLPGQGVIVASFMPLLNLSAHSFRTIYLVSFATHPY